MPQYRSKTSTAGRNMAGEEIPYRHLPAFWSDLRAQELIPPQAPIPGEN